MNNGPCEMLIIKHLTIRLKLFIFRQYMLVWCTSC